MGQIELNYLVLLLWAKTPALLEPHYQIVSCHIEDTRWRSLTLLQRCSRCILQPQPTWRTIFKKNKILLMINTTQQLLNPLLVLTVGNYSLFEHCLFEYESAESWNCASITLKSAYLYACKIRPSNKHSSTFVFFKVIIGEEIWAFSNING